MARNPLTGAVTPGVGNGPGGDKPKRKQTRPQGPRSLWIVLNEGADVATVRSAINMITFNGRVVLQNMEEGAPKPMLKFTLAASKRGGGAADEDAGEFTPEAGEQPPAAV